MPGLDKVNHLTDRSFVIMLALMAAILSVALIVLVGYERGIGTDGAFYALSGYHWLHSGMFTYSDVPNTFTWPMLSLLVGVVSLGIDNLQVCMHVVLTSAFALSVFPFYYSLKNFFGRDTARLGGMLFVLNGFLIRLSVRMLPEMLVVFFVAMSLYMISKVYRRVQDGGHIPPGAVAWAGLYTGLAYLTKPEAGLVALSAVAAVVFITRGKRPKWAVSLLPLTFAVTILPQVMMIHAETGKWQLTTYNRFFFRGAIEPLVSLQPGKAAADPHVEYNYNAYLMRGPYSEAEAERDWKLLPTQLRKFCVSFITVIGIVHVLVIALGMIRKSFPRPIGVWLFYVMPMLGIFFWYNIVDRLFLPFVPWFLAISAAVLAAGKPWPSRWMERTRVTAIVLIVLQSVMPIANQSPTNAVIGNHDKLGKWMKNHLNIEGQLIADRKPYITAEVKGRYYRYNQSPDIPTLVAELQQRGVEYLVVDDFYTRTKNPGVAQLLDRRDHPGLEWVHEEVDERWGRAILYRVTTP